MNLALQECDSIKPSVDGLEYYRPTGRIGHYNFRTRKLRAEDSCYVL